MTETESNLHTETVRLSADGAELESYLAYDDQSDARRPGVLVIHEWWGLNDYIRRRAHMLAELGLSALAVDMYGGGEVADNPDDAGRHLVELSSLHDIVQKRSVAESLRR